MAKKVLLEIGPIDNFTGRPQCIRKSKQISGQTILGSPQDAQFNPNFAKNRNIPVFKNSVTRPVTSAVLTTDSYKEKFDADYS